jgi:hypothetical protein
MPTQVYGYNRLTAYKINTGAATHVMTRNLVEPFKFSACFYFNFISFYSFTHAFSSDIYSLVVIVIRTVTEST